MTGSRKRAWCSFIRWPPVIAATVLLLVPSAAHAQPITVLEMIIGGTTIFANFAGITSSLLQIFGQPAIDSLSDDHPLYTNGQSSPSLSIAATETTFDLLLKQTNDVSEFEDDDPAVLKGTTFVSTPSGETKAWEWKLTIEADIGSVTGFNFKLDAQGFVQHLFIPHPELNERTPAPAMNYDLLLRKVEQGMFSASAFDSVIHNLGPHPDTLRGTLDADFSTAGLNHIDFFNVSLRAAHVPEPATLLLLAIGLVGIGAGDGLRRRRRRAFENRE